MPAFLIPIILEAASSILEALGIVSTILTVVNAIKNALAPGGVPLDLATTEIQVATIYADVQSPTIGLALIAARLSVAEAAILAAIANTQQAGVAVTLPAPPAGYGGLSGSATALAVWDFVDSVTGHTMLQDVSIMTNVAEFISQQTMLEAVGVGYFWLLGVAEEYDTLGRPTTFPTPLVANILPADTVGTWLTREVPSITWSAGFYGGDLWGGNDPSGHWSWICKIDPLRFAQYKLLNAGSLAKLGPPVWPGSAFATLGSPVALSSGLTITTPMDGVIVNLSSVPTVRGFYEFDDLRSYRNVGALTFLSDAGEAEYPQGLGFTSAMYSPKSMKRAAAVKVRTAGGVVGTVTPWLSS
jgi:hypothetical protein